MQEISTRSTRKLAECAQAISQGATLSRYRDEGGRAYRVVNASDLETLELSVPRDELTLEVLKEGSYLDNALEPGDVLIAARGEELKASVVTEPYAGCLAGANLAVLRPARNADGEVIFVEPFYLAGLFRTDWMKGRLSGLYMQSSQVQLVTVKQLRELELPLPPLEVQRRFAELFLTFEDYAKTLSEALYGRRQLIEAALQTTLGNTQGDTHADA